jgi:hypothetical protein
LSAAFRTMMALAASRALLRTGTTAHS